MTAADQEDVHRTIEQIARESYGRFVAYLSSHTRDVAGAEDALNSSAHRRAVGLRAAKSRGVAADDGAPLAHRFYSSSTSCFSRRAAAPMARVDQHG
jgi:hypothetical protein